ncbi:uncharacterized protein PG986_006196 [Apiospora aurea]|uniref:Uncharacterized protein n=1 Tax=Apiospora aurea TaxID=335848 RepID=A0ABR1QJQ9_9PEZI
MTQEVELGLDRTNTTPRTSLKEAAHDLMIMPVTFPEHFYGRGDCLICIKYLSSLGLPPFLNLSLLIPEKLPQRGARNTDWPYGASDLQPSSSDDIPSHPSEHV